MIISHKHKFIFIKPQKTAGTSVELLLSQICGPDDIITPLGFDPDPNVREENNAKPPQNYYRPKPLKNWELRELYWFIRKGRKPNLNYWEHLPAEKIREYAGEEIWSEYIKISIVRNPWDHAVSQFIWMKKYGYGGVKDDFKHFLECIYKSQWPFLNSQGIMDIDSIIKFENLESGIVSIQKKLNTNIPYRELPITKSNVRKGNNYKGFFNDITREIVELKNISLLHYFHYDF